MNAKANCCSDLRAVTLEWRQLSALAAPVRTDPRWSDLLLLWASACCLSLDSRGFLFLRLSMHRFLLLLF